MCAFSLLPYRPPTTSSYYFQPGSRQPHHLARVHVEVNVVECGARGEACAQPGGAWRRG